MCVCVCVGVRACVCVHACVHVVLFMCTEYDSLSRLGLEDPRGYAKSRFGGRTDTVLLDSCLLGPSYLGQVESALEDTQNSETWLDIQVRWRAGQSKGW